MDAFEEVLVQCGALLISISLGLVMAWGFLAGFFRVFFSPAQTEQVGRSAEQHERS
jgi:hypothetical protein